MICVGVATHAQQPSHYILGEEELVGIHIYSIAQDKEANIWLSTNNGLIKYDGYNFQPIKPTSAKSGALFGLTKDKDENLFCCNLNGQIFKLNNDSLHLFFEIPDSLLSNLIHFNFDNNNHLVFCTDNYYLVRDNGEIQFLLSSEYSSNRIAKTKNDELIFINSPANQIALFKNNSIRSIEQLDVTVNYPFVAENTTFLSALYSSKVYTYRNKNWSKIDFEKLETTNNSIVEFQPINDSLLSFTFKNNGISFYDDNGTLKYKNAKLFPRHRISCTLNDREGNLWLPTLGKGIIIIPNPEIVDYNDHPFLKEDDLKAITSDANGTIYTAGLNGSIYEIKNQEVAIIQDQKIEIEFLKFHDQSHSLIVNNSIYLLSNGRRLTMTSSSAKDIAFVDSTHLYLATNQGLFYASMGDIFSNKTELELLSENRTFCVTYDKKRQEIWAGTTKGLLHISGDKHTFILHDKQQISVTDIEYVQNEIWVSTLNNGILIFRDGVFAQAFTHTNQKHISNLSYRNSKLYFTSDLGLHIHDFENQTTITISKTDGLLSNKIIDYEIVNNDIWFILPNGLQRINSQKLYRNEIPPTLKWTSILVNNEPQNRSASKAFSYLQNQFEFHFVASAFRHQGKLTYHYQLEGLNDTWQQTSYRNNLATFSSLPHGNYTFNAKAINENGIESQTITYTFSISPPFWLTWWFFLLCALALIIIVASFFIVRIRIIKRRLSLEKRLKISEITAIKAQMNPHFMFNALNSIQDLIMLKDIRSSNEYLGMFSDLMRKTLEFSSKNYIALTDEIDILELYLELEKLRFGHEFTVVINHDFTKDQLQEIKIPSMLLQPYVENAIKHGLLHKKGSKELTINFKMNNTALICEVIDNGVGRKKSAEIKERREKSYPSFSTKANQKRIDLIRESTNKSVNLTIIDLYKNGVATGTKVILEFE